MASLVLHVGTPKTGTTALQKFFMDNAESLADEDVLFFGAEKLPGVPREVNGRFLTLSVLDEMGLRESDEKTRRAIERTVSLFEDAVASRGRVVLSDEWLWNHGTSCPGFWKELRRRLAQMGVSDIVAVVYLRRQDEFLCSLWNQRVKSDVRVTCGLLQYAHEREIECNMDYDSGVRGLEEAFGKENVVVRVYDRSELAGKDIRVDFCEQFGIDVGDDFAFRNDSESNLSIANNNVIEIKRQANHVEGYRKAPNFLRGPAIRSSILPDAVDNASMLAPRDREELLRRYSEGNARIARDYLGRVDGVLFQDVDSFPAEWKLDRDSFERDIIRFFTDALTVEHEKREATKRKADRLEKLVEQLANRVEELERQTADLRKMNDQLEKRAGSLNAVSGVFARLRRKHRRS